MSGKNILLGVTGSVAATLTPRLVAALDVAGLEVRIMATRAACYFFEHREFAGRLWTDDREWPSMQYRKGQEIPHIALGDWADALVIAPLTANTLAKLAHGLADNLLTCTVRAWPVGKPFIAAPAMNTRMLESQLTGRQVSELRSNYGALIMPTQSKRLACGTVGPGAMADVADIVAAVRAAVGK